MASHFAYQQFHASLNDKSELEECNAVAPRYEWVQDTYSHLVSGSEDKKIETKVKDAYQWLEDPDSSDTQKWVDCQVNMCEQYLNSLKAPTRATPDNKDKGETNNGNGNSNNNNTNNNNNSNNNSNNRETLMRHEIEKDLKENLKFGRFSTPYRKQNYYFYRYNEGTWNQSKLYVLPKSQVDKFLNKIRETKLYGNGDISDLQLCTDDNHVLIDPNTLADDGTSQLKYLYHSENGQLLAYTVSHKGSDWLEIHVKNVKEFVDNMEKLPHAKKKQPMMKSRDSQNENKEEEVADVIKHCKFGSVTWTHDNKGFFYTRYDAPGTGAGSNEKKEDKDKEEGDDKTGQKKEDKSLGTETGKLSNQKLYYHKLGDLQSNDTFITDAISFGNENWLVGHATTFDGKYLIITLSSDCDPLNRVYLCKRSDGSVITCENGNKDILNGMIKLVDNFDAGYDYVTNENTLFYFRTNLNAPNYRVISIDISNKEVLNCISNNKQNDLKWNEIIKEKECRLDVARCVGKTKQFLYLDYTIDVKTQLFLTSLDGKMEPYLINRVKDENDKNFKDDGKGYFPAHGCLGGWGSRHFDEGFIFFESWLHPASIFHFNFVTKELLLFAQLAPKNYNGNDYVTEQIFFRYKTQPICKTKSIRHNKFEIVRASKNKEDLESNEYKNNNNNNDDNGISPIIPMYIIYKKCLINPKTQRPYEGESIPTILYGYGGFDISIMPYFSALRLYWLSNFNGIYAFANIRGGGEYGETWHESGTKLLKQNVFNDFQAAATCLIENLKYTNKENLIIEGGSNGGLLVGACCNQRPDLFKCGIAHVGVMDMLKFHKFTIGYAWISDYGSSENEKDKREFDYLYDYSPLHNIPNPDEALKLKLKAKEEEKENNNNDEELVENILEYGNTHQYPCFLALTADHDDRVVPLHSFKFMAELQYRFHKYKRQVNPLLIRIDVKAGHGGSSLTKAIKNKADIYTFLVKCMNLQWIRNEMDDESGVIVTSPQGL